MLTVRNLRVRYGAVEILHSISLEVGPGEIVALLGANGAGKTTTLLAISGVAPVTAGVVQWEGRPLQALPPDRIVAQGVIHVPEGRRVFPRLTVLENLKLGAYRLSRGTQRPGDVHAMWELFPVLRERQHQLAGTLSGGEQQMLALARGLMAQPSLLLLDEPSLGLAPKVVAQLFSVIQQINARGIPILLVEQNAYQALQIARRAYVLAAGQVVLEGPTSRLMADPAVKAAYLGG